MVFLTLYEYTVDSFYTIIRTLKGNKNAVIIMGNYVLRKFHRALGNRSNYWKLN